MLIVIAQKEELDLVKKLGYDKYPIIITGVGIFNVCRALRDIPKDTKIINIGYAGSDDFKIGDLVNIIEVSTFHNNAKFTDRKSLHSSNNSNNEAMCITSTDFVTSKMNLEPKNLKVVYDMELAIICALFDNVESFKFISDNLSKDEYDKNIN